jgi:hypothetical protein
MVSKCDFQLNLDSIECACIRKQKYNINVYKSNSSPLSIQQSEHFFFNTHQIKLVINLKNYCI